MQALAVQKIQINNSSDILRRITQRDKTALKESIASYGNLVWAMAKKFTDTTEDAEAVTQEIFPISGVMQPDLRKPILMNSFLSPLLRVAN